MGLFSFLTKEISVDLGTTNTVILHKGDIVIDEPSVVALERSSGKLKAAGKKAFQLHDKNPQDIKIIHPMNDGVIADFQSAEYMIRRFIRTSGLKGRVFSSALQMVISIPSNISEVEQRAVKDLAEFTGAKDIRLIHKSMAAAIGVGLDVLEPTGNLVVYLGGGNSEIAVIALGGTVNQKSIRVTGNEINAVIEAYMRNQYHLHISEHTTEKIKIGIGAAMTGLDNPPPDFLVHGRDMFTGIQKEIYVNYAEIVTVLEKSVSEIEDAVIHILETTPPELASDIYRTGIYLAGGGSLLRGLDKRIHQKTRLPVYIADDPLLVVARGAGIALKNFDKFPFLIK